MSIQAIRDWAKANPSRLQALLERNESYVFFKNDPQDIYFLLFFFT